MTHRYLRQTLFDGIGATGQEKLLAARVAILGCGALGACSAETLARAGVGRLLLIDRDFVDESNLQRQTLFTESHASQAIPKAIAARQALSEINSEVIVDAQVVDLTSENIENLLQGCDLLLDGLDNFETRFLLNDYAVARSCPWVYGAALGSYGISFAVEAGGPCLRCFLPEPPPAGSLATCESAGILAPVVQAVSAFQVAQAMRWIVGAGFQRLLLRADVWKGEWRTSPLFERIPGCPCCAGRRFPHLSGDSRDRLVRLCGRDSVQVRPAHPVEMDFPSLSRRIGQSLPVRGNEHLLRIDAEGCEIALFRDGRSIIRGTADPSRARALYAKYVGN